MSSSRFAVCGGTPALPLTIQAAAEQAALRVELASAVTLVLRLRGGLQPGRQVRQPHEADPTSRSWPRSRRQHDEDVERDTASGLGVPDWATLPRTLPPPG